MNEYYYITKEGADEQYDTIEERINIVVSEQYTAHKTGEFPWDKVTRTDHSSGDWVRVENSTSTTIINE